MNPAQAKVEHKTCFKCNYEADTVENVCPRCGKVLRGSRNLRIRGGVLIGTGGFLIVFIGAIAAFVGYLLYSGTMHIPPSQAARTGVVMALMFGLFGLVMLFGTVAIINGTYMLKTGRRSLVLMWIMFGIVFMLIFISLTVSIVLK